ncbi:hypothetical protein CY0110_15652 [Crocosphaera chwakensis CCY0110]|uniref:Uncharacterized protein n=1 Tax=Crocosphaera chwakensis CCY0110 TaxID=391612 RepID=A3IHG2_9CHRO|nr:hypothetical protein CY0110_15652 [Crocosphaera chwakensis CCY0110]
MLEKSSTPVSTTGRSAATSPK